MLVVFVGLTSPLDVPVVELLTRLFFFTFSVDVGAIKASINPAESCKVCAFGDERDDFTSVFTSILFSHFISTLSSLVLSNGFFGASGFGLTCLTFFTGGFCGVNSVTKASSRDFPILILAVSGFNCLSKIVSVGFCSLEINITFWLTVVKLPSNSTILSFFEGLKISSFCESWISFVLSFGIPLIFTSFCSWFWLFFSFSRLRFFVLSLLLFTTLTCSLPFPPVNKFIQFSFTCLALVEICSSSDFTSDLTIFGVSFSFSLSTVIGKTNKSCNIWAKNGLLSVFFAPLTQLWIVSHPPLCKNLNISE